MTATMTQTIHQEPLRSAQLYGTPLFYYSLPTLRAQIARLRRALSDFPVRLLFATMANDRSEILRAISSEGVGACVNSIPHLQRALAHGFPADDIQFTSCGVPLNDMTYLQAMGIAVNLDSPTQIEAWCRLKPGMVAGARVNAAALNATPATSDRIGMDLASLDEARDKARRLGGRVNGLHVYAGTNFQRSREILPTIRALFDLVRQYPDIDYVNIGGGIGVDYSHTDEPFDYEDFGREVCALATASAATRERPLALLFEPGRSMVASSGTFVTRVTDVKTLHGARYVVVDASVSVFPRPFHQPGSLHRASVLYTPEALKDECLVPSVVAGRTTFSRDILGRYELPDSLSVGSLLALEDAGAYCESMTSRFLGQREASCFVAEE